MEPRASAWAQQPRESAPASPVPGSDSASSAVKAGEYGQDFSSGGEGGPPAWSDGNKHLGVVASLLLALDQGSPGGENKHHSQESDTVSTLVGSQRDHSRMDVGGEEGAGDRDNPGRHQGGGTSLSPGEGSRGETQTHHLPYWEGVATALVCN